MPDRSVNLHPYSTGCYRNNLISLTYFQPSWDDDTDDFLKAMLTGSDLSTEISGIGSEAVCPSDTSSDSGCPEDRVRTLTSPGLDDGPRYSPCLDYSPLPNSPHSTHSVDLVEYLSNGNFKKLLQIHQILTRTGPLSYFHQEKGLAPDICRLYGLTWHATIATTTTTFPFRNI